MVTTANHDSIQLQIASGPGALNCGTVPLNGSGVANFSGTCEITEAGSYTLDAVDVHCQFHGHQNHRQQFVHDLSAIHSGQVGLRHFAGERLDRRSGSGFPVAVAVEDQYGNIITATPTSTTITVEVTSGTGTGGAALSCAPFPGNTAAVSSGTGTANFASDCSINDVGSGYTLTATSSPGVTGTFTERGLQRGHSGS